VSLSAVALLGDLDAYSAANDREQASLVRIREFVSRSPGALSRANAEGHVTASAIVADPQTPAFLLIWHRKLGCWLQPGGHLEEDDASVFAAGLREAREETGIAVFGFPSDDRILDVDVHPIPAYGPDPAHFHYDIRYLLTAPDTAACHSDTRWFTLPEALAAGADDSLARALRKALARLAGSPSP
jgi:8-oxo-dGTP pyrophosphatase MutT (NUDIX family)